MPPITPVRQTGRYADRRSARAPAQGLARPPASGAIRTAVAAVPDPMEPGARLLATVNRRTDILELERSHGRISEAAYQVGRVLQEAFERAGRLGSSSNWNDGGRVDIAERHELAIAYAVQDARRVQALMRRVEAAVGVVGARMLRAVIGDRTSFAAIATARGRAGDRAVRDVAERFRWLLEETAEQFAARGPDRGRIR